MIAERLYLSHEKTAWIDTYILNPEVAHGAKKIWPAVIVVPGGAYLTVATREGEAIAMQFLEKGYSCFVLHYAPYIKNRLTMLTNNQDTDENAHYPSQEKYLMEAMHLIHKNHEQWNLDDKRIFTIGFSAGSHITGMLAERWNDPEFTKGLSFVPKAKELRPAGSILCYPMTNGDNHSQYMIDREKRMPGMSRMAAVVDQALYGRENPDRSEIYKLDLLNYVSADTAPIFVWHTTDDQVVSPIETTKFILKLQETGVSCEYHLYRHGPHGLGSAKKTYALKESESDVHISTWIQLAAEWMEEVISG